ncbi:MAG TPA: phosphodiester glycosidase family protein [Candidatus Elarobacter sp.]|nr:phosphodiester glycosidase family protein [Candidatus Elarobacter sp.]HEV2737848.1 phosphodiester glycosidase family protein [Candidatus Elarobacter sp.]
MKVRRALLAVFTGAAMLGAAPASAPSVEPLALGTLVRSSFVAADGRTVQVQSAIFPRDRVTIGIVDYPLGGPPGEMVSRAFTPPVIAAVTGGYFLDRFRPKGLLEIGGSVREPARADMSGIVGSLTDETPVVVPSAGVSTASLKDAIQAGPFVVDPGGAFGIRSDDHEHDRRAIVFLAGDQIGVALTSSCTLYELAEGLTRSPAAFGVDRVERALNLSGSRSAGIAVRLPNGHVQGDPELIRIRTVLTIRRRAAES